VINFGVQCTTPLRAGGFVKELTTSSRKTLSFFPYSGKVVDNLDLGNEIRICSHGNYNAITMF
jgi:hypothetical protein